MTEASCCSSQFSLRPTQVRRVTFSEVKSLALPSLTDWSHFIHRKNNLIFLINFMNLKILFTHPLWLLVLSLLRSTQDNYYCLILMSDWFVNDALEFKLQKRPSELMAVQFTSIQRRVPIKIKFKENKLKLKNIEEPFLPQLKPNYSRQISSS
jgi:hypothetical protein